MKWTMFIAASLVVLTGCATKHYGRLQDISGTESQYYTCREIAIEISKVEEFRQQVADGAQVNWKSVAGFLGDYGIGNAIEKDDAEKSATKRMNELLALKTQHGCDAPLGVVVGMVAPAYTPPMVAAPAGAP